MEDEWILLKIKREFTTNEAVQSLLKMVATLEFQIGVLKSDLCESNDKLNKIVKEGTKTKKQWMQEEVFKNNTKQIETISKKAKDYQASMVEWRQRYFSLLAQQNKDNV